MYTSQGGLYVYYTEDDGVSWSLWKQLDARNDATADNVGTAVAMNNANVSTSTNGRCVSSIQ